LRKHRPNVTRPFRLPEFFKYIALAMAVFYAVIWLYGGISFARIGHTEIYYFLGWVVAAAYIPFYLYRTRIEDKRVAAAAEREAVMPPGAVPSK
jgi:hypothetical protein